MTTPPRPSLADTIARIDAVLADLKKTTAAEAARLDEAVADHTAKLDAQPPCLRCARKSLIDSPFCAYHLPCPIDQDAVIAKGGTFAVTVPDGYEIIRPRGGITENGHVLPWPPYLQPALDEAARQSAAQLYTYTVTATGPPGSTVTVGPFRRPVPEPAWGWFGRLLNRLIP